MHTVIAAPIALICICTASVRLGEWRAKTMIHAQKGER